MPKVVKPAGPVYQIKITLEQVKPAVWRRLLVPANITLARLHRLLQIAMGWSDSHLHQFETRGMRYAPPDPYGDDDFSPMPVKRTAKVRLAEAMPAVKAVMHYDYDFGDGWRHRIVVEKLIADAGDVPVPVCLAGANACPPEDSGGPWGYADMLIALKDPSHPLHEEKTEWLTGYRGRGFDPAYFNGDDVNPFINPKLRKGWVPAKP